MELTMAQPAVSLRNLGLRNSQVFYQLDATTLAEQTLLRGQGTLNNTGALCVQTGSFTGRSPQDKFIVDEPEINGHIHWNSFNQPISKRSFEQLRQKMVAYLNAAPELWVRDAYACAHPQYQLNVRVVNEQPWANLFAHNLFLRPSGEELAHFVPEWTILQAPGFVADPLIDGTRSPHFAIICFSAKTILIGGTGYTGEMKKGIFTVLNYLLPVQHGVLPMHCSANVGAAGDTAIFFGLSGTGKTTLSADAQRQLVGDDEHAWTADSLFNMEGGCYAKCIDLDEEKEPGIFNAIKPGALVENVGFVPGTNHIDFACRQITENTRVSYPLHFIPNAVQPSVAGTPAHIFFLTCDANGVLPPISRLTPGQAMYQFISGYTARVAGTEAGVTEPKSTFSACFGAPFMPLHPTRYAAMLGKKMEEHQVPIWLVNTGWVGGPYGVGSRIKLAYTRALIQAALAGQLEEVPFTLLPIFNLKIPVSCPGVPAPLLCPRSQWANTAGWDARATQLAQAFIANFDKYRSAATPQMLEAEPKPTV